MEKEVKSITSDIARSLTKRYYEDPSQFLGDKGKDLINKCVAKVEDSATSGRSYTVLDATELNRETTKIVHDFFASRGFIVKTSWSGSKIKVSW